MNDIRDSLIWKSAFDEKHAQTDIQKTALSRLITTYNIIEDRIKPLINNIPNSCKNLTIHDISHVHQLWTVADQICGDGYVINPLEGFVLAVSFLIHDAGLTASAYPGGEIALRSTKLYQDFLSYRIRRIKQRAPLKSEIDSPSDDISSQALFDTLRTIHAHRAENILEIAFDHPLGLKEYRIFPDEDLFLDCGEVIGLVAASHHWPMRAVHTKFPALVTPPAAFGGWAIDAFKLACILRCSDACAIDERRSRIMPFILTDPKGISLDHWDFQARLKPGFRNDDQLVFESKISFRRTEMSAWWTAYEAIAVADRELRDCDKYLRLRSKRDRASSNFLFAVRSVDGANNPDRLKQLVRVQGWLPVDTSVRISNPISLIEKLGGWALYGNDLIAPVRELIQNAADAVRARRSQDSDINYDSLIRISINIDPTSDKLLPFIFSISDNGIGMSPDILTGTLLDFGESLWSSEKSIHIHPGLMNNIHFQPTGQFGIGFYSSFMVAESVKVSSRPWDAALGDRKVLQFKNGIKSRAELRNFSSTEDAEVEGGSVTTVSLSIKNPNWLNHLASMSYNSKSPDEPDNRENYWSALEMTFKRLTVALDVPCKLKIGNRPEILLNNINIFEIPNLEFAQIFNETLATNDEDRKKIRPAEVELIRPIADDLGRIHTRGLIDMADERGWIHVGGLSVFGRVDGLIRGIVGYSPGTAARQGGGRTASDADIGVWAQEQLNLIDKEALGEDFFLKAVAKLGNTKIDVSKKAVVRSDRKVIYIDEIFESKPQLFSIFIGLQRVTMHDDDYEIGNVIHHSDDIIDFVHNFRFSSSGVIRSIYDRIKKDLSYPDNGFQLFSILMKSLKEREFSVVIQGPELFEIGTYSGPRGGRGRLLNLDIVPGMKIKEFGIVITASKTMPLLK